MLGLKKLLRVSILVLLGSGLPAFGADWYLDGNHGADGNDGTSPDTAWRSLERLREVTLRAGDRIWLRRGSAFAGSLVIEGQGTADAPIIAGAYGDGPLPRIDAAGHRAGVHIHNAAHVEVRDLEITGDGGAMVDGSPGKERFGVLVGGGGKRYGKPFRHIALRGLVIHDIFAPVGSPHEGKRSATHLGYGIAIRGNPDGRDLGHVVVAGCRIERTGFKAIEASHVSHIEVLDNRMRDIGGPAIQPGNVNDMIVRGNVVHGSGSFLDPRMHGRGSGIWPWTCERMLIERNTFIGARGKADSCGIHIDFNCRDVIVQYNLSIDNEGGFIEILGNNYNCAYRFNISINDGARVKGRDGAHQEGKVLWTSGYVGRNRPKAGPFNSYLYNNTIYVGPESRSAFSVSGTTEGLLIANNIFHLLGSTVSVAGDQDSLEVEAVGSVARTSVTHNLVIREDLLPDELPFDVLEQVVGDARFRNPGGLNPADYIPRNTSLVAGRGIRIEALPGDDKGLTGGFTVGKDFLGNPVPEVPDLGAIQVTRPD